MGPKSPRVQSSVTALPRDLSTEWIGWPKPAEAANAKSPTDEGRFGRKVARAVKVLAMLLLLALFAVVTAYLFMLHLLRATSGETARTLIQAGTAGLTSLALITAIREIALIFGKLFDYVSKNKAVSDLIAEYVKYFTTVLSISASIFAFTLAPEPEATSARKLPSELLRPIYLTPASEPGDYFPYLFGLADGPPGWRKGTTLSGVQVEDIEKMVATLRACSGQGSNDRVVVEVVGYADANEFAQARDAGISSTELNRQTANRRADDLARVIRSALGKDSRPHTVEVLPVFHWPKDGPPLMTDSQRYFKAKKLTETDQEDQGLFNRRAEVVLKSAGTCKRLEPRASTN